MKRITITFLALALALAIVTPAQAGDDEKITGFARYKAFTGSQVVTFPYDVDWFQVVIKEGPGVEFTAAVASTDSLSTGVQKYPDALSLCPVFEAIVGVPFTHNLVGNVRKLRITNLDTDPSYVLIPYSEAE